MENILSQIKARLMNSISTKIHVKNPKSISVYAEVRATIGHILKRFVPYLIKSDLWFYILNFVFQINLSPQTTLVKFQRVLRNNYVKKLYFCNMTRIKTPAFFQIPYQ